MRFWGWRKRTRWNPTTFLVTSLSHAFDGLLVLLLIGNLLRRNFGPRGLLLPAFDDLGAASSPPEEQEAADRQ